MVTFTRRVRRDKSINLIVALPYENFRNSKHFDSEWQSRYDTMISNSNYVINVTEKDYETDGCYQRRNIFMIDNSNRLICYHIGKSGGTANSIKYARSKNMEIVNVADLI